MSVKKKKKNVTEDEKFAPCQLVDFIYRVFYYDVLNFILNPVCILSLKYPTCFTADLFIKALLWR